MTKYQKVTLVGAVIYTLLTIMFTVFDTDETRDLIPTFVISSIFLFLLLGMFYLGFKKKKALFANLAVGWLAMSSIYSIYQFRSVFPTVEGENINYFIAGSIVSFVGMVVWTYFAFRAAFDITSRSSRQSNPSR